MNIKAKLFVCGEERELISTSLNYIRLTDWNGKPTSALMGGTFTVTYESQMYDDTFIEWGIADRAENKKIDYPANLYLLRDGKVVFYEDDFDGVELFQYNFQDGTLINYHEVFNNQEGMYVTLTISPTMQDYRFFKNSTDWRRKSRTRYIKPWQESFIPPIKETPYKAQDNTRSKKVLNLYFEDVETKEKVKKVKPDQLVELVIVSKEMKNKKVDIDLNKYPFNFEYNKKPLEKNILKDILITNDTQKLTVKPLKKG
ncbi:type VI secretion system tube protein TssD [Tenacibaculum sp. Ill]|uniref:type VI secretion system tube protein TssD n=1 Tax=Tenacibaculum sp. Ill TaxID=3445935 RepID=UPI003F78F966